MLARPDGTIDAVVLLDRQVLWHRVTIAAEPSVAAAARNALSYLEVTTTHALPVVASVDYLLRPHDEQRIDVVENGHTLATVAIGDLLDLLYVRIHRRAFELASLRGWLRVHAAVLDLAVGRTLLVAPSGVGKTTLAARLLADGDSVPSDEAALVRGDRAIAVPRRFHLRPGTLRLVGPLHEEGVPLPNGSGVAALDAGANGRPLRIDDQPIGAIVMVGRGERSALQRVAGMSILADFVEQIFPHEDDPGDIVAAAALLVSAVGCWRLTTGDPGEAADLLRNLGRPTGSVTEPER